MIFARELGSTLGALLRDDPRVVLLGEDIVDPYGGAFKVTRGLSTEFPDRVRSTPVSEQAIAGISAGLALAGMRPIAEVMFGDFVGLCFDQVVNHMAKFQAMYAGRATCPAIVRVPSGGGRGYGPTHSQSLEKHFLGVPHLRVVAASLHHDVRQTFDTMLSWDEPVLYVEHKMLYPQHMGPVVGGRIGDHFAAVIGGEDGSLPTIGVSLVPEDECTVTVVAYGYQAVAALEAIEQVAVDDEVFVRLLVPGQIWPTDHAPIASSVARTGALVTVEEGTRGHSWGTEVAAQVHRSCFSRLRHPVEICASESAVIPSAKQLESRVLMGPSQIRDAIMRVA